MGLEIIKRNIKCVSTGNILVGTTTDNGSKFQVNGAATFASSVTNSSFFRVLSSSFQHHQAEQV
jgi:hypothetical protein